MRTIVIIFFATAAAGTTDELTVLDLRRPNERSVQRLSHGRSRQMCAPYWTWFIHNPRPLEEKRT
ncbi:MAG: hypothetical protein WCE51_13445 [Chthoniobacterales bacterium]